MKSTYRSHETAKNVNTPMKAATNKHPAIFNNPPLTGHLYCSGTPSDKQQGYFGQNQGLIESGSSQKQHTKSPQSFL